MQFITLHVATRYQNTELFEIRLKSRGIAMKPVRKIPNNHRSITGLVASRTASGLKAFESSLERDFFLLLEFDCNVFNYIEQPIKIPYKGKDSRMHTYTPDVLVVYSQDKSTNKWPTPELCEIKYREDFFQQWPAAHLKYRAATRFAREKGWQFRIITEKEVRTPLLQNARFLLTYRRSEKDIDWKMCRVMIDKLNELRIATPEGLLLALYHDPINRAQALPILWFLIGSGFIGVNLFSPLTMSCQIWSQRIL